MTETPTSQQATAPIRVGILWTYADQSPLYAPWIQNADESLEITILRDYPPDLDTSDFDVLITHMHYRWDELTILRRAFEQQCTAILLLADGILEYRNTWYHPDIPDGSMMQPAIAHKIATLGPAQNRLLHSWGNHGKCECVGLSRLDSLVEKHNWWQPVSRPPRDSFASPLKLLITSATTPAFDQAQWDTVHQTFQDLQTQLEQTKQDLEITWRVAEPLRERLKLAEPTGQPPLHDAIEQSDAVLTTASTIQLEAMICRKPTILLDYFNYPNFVPAAWRISRPEHVSEIVDELTQPETKALASRLNFQDITLRDQLWTWDSATHRLLDLIQKMGRAAQEARRSGQPVRCDDSMLTGPAVHEQHYQTETVTFLRETHGVLATDSISDWMQRTEVQAALQRARQASEERARSLHLEKVIKEQQDNYEEIVAEKQGFIDNGVEQLNKVNQRHAEVSALLESRNQEFERVQRKIQELSEARIEDHRMLAEAHADAKAKQQRVNELRERCQNLVERNEELRQSTNRTPEAAHQTSLLESQRRLETLQQHNQNYQEQLDNAQERLARLKEHHDQLTHQLSEAKARSQRLTEQNQQLTQRIDELVEERKDLYQRLKERTSG